MFVTLSKTVLHGVLLMNLLVIVQAKFSSILVRNYVWKLYVLITCVRVLSPKVVSKRPLI